MSRSIAELLSVAEPDRDPDWLEESLQSAVKLEFATIPLYLAALWSIKDPPPAPPSGQSWPASTCAGAYAVLRGIAVEEMLHFGLVCNMLATIGATPRIVDAVPSYPAQGLPGGVRPDLHVTLAGLTPERVKKLFMQIEYPEYPVRDDPPPAPPPKGDFATIGALYDAIANAFQLLNPPIKGGDTQLTGATFDNYGCIGATGGGAEQLLALNEMSQVLDAIERIKEQGEGTSAGPDAPDYQDELAHYFKFGSVYHGRLYVQTDGQWDYTGPPIPFPDVYPMQEVPEGGYPDPARDVAIALANFNKAFSSVIDGLDAAWKDGDNDKLGAAINTMFGLAGLAQLIYEKPVPGTQDTYGPTFEYV